MDLGPGGVSREALVVEWAGCFKAGEYSLVAWSRGTEVEVDLASLMGGRGRGREESGEREGERERGRGREGGGERNREEDNKTNNGSPESRKLEGWETRGMREMADGDGIAGGINCWWWRRP